MMKKTENGETVIGMLHHVIIGLRYWSRKCTPSWTSDDEEEYRGDGEILEETSEDAERPLTESARTDDVPKVFHRIRVETTLVTIYKETMFSEALEYLFDMLLMVSHVVG